MNLSKDANRPVALREKGIYLLVTSQLDAT